MLDIKEPGVRDMFLYHPEIENPVKNTAQTENVHKIAMKALLIVYLIDSGVIIENINIIKKNHTRIVEWPIASNFW